MNEIEFWIVFGFALFFIADFFWKIATQHRLDKLEGKSNERT